MDRVRRENWSRSLELGRVDTRSEAYLRLLSSTGPGGKVEYLSSIDTTISLDHVENFAISEGHYALEMARCVQFIFKVADKDWHILSWPGPG